VTDLYDLQPLSTKAREMLDAERACPAAPEAVVARVRERVAVSVGSSAGLGTTHHGSTGASSVAGRAVRTVANRPRFAVGALVVGIGIGAFGHAWLAQKPIREVTTVPAAPSLPTAPLSAAPSVVPPSVAETAVTASPLDTAPRRIPGGAASRDTDLALERALIDRARLALARGQGKDALDALLQHGRDYPRGRMNEECDALTVQALALEGRMDEARRRAARFDAEYPTSLFSPAVHAAVAAEQ
jgi:hypothetical protein